MGLISGGRDIFSKTWFFSLASFFCLWIALWSAFCWACVHSGKRGWQLFSQYKPSAKHRRRTWVGEGEDALCVTTVQMFCSGKMPAWQGAPEHVEWLFFGRSRSPFFYIPRTICVIYRLCPSPSRSDPGGSGQISGTAEPESLLEPAQW